MTTSTGPIAPNPTASVNPSPASLTELANLDFAGPIAMLNLLRFDGEEGRALYGRYAQVAGKTIAHVDGALLCHARVAHPASWDSVALVFYPNVQAYLDMQADQRYIDAIPDRTAGLSARLLCPFALPDMTAHQAQDRVTNSADGSVEIELVRWVTPDITQGPQRTDDVDPAVSLRLRAVGSGLVTDGRWDELRLQNSALACTGQGVAPETGVVASEVVIGAPVDQP